MALLFSFLTLIMLPSPSHQTETPRVVVDRIIKDSAFNSFPKHLRTTHLYKVQLPSNLSGITAEVARFRAGSLRRHGTNVSEFTFAPGVVVHPHMTRIIVIQQNLGNYSYMYNISGYQLVTPALGLLIYDAANLSGLNVFVRKQPITINFSEILHSSHARDAQAMCATFQLDGNVSLSNLSDDKLCFTWRQGHFAVVAKLSLPSPPSTRMEEEKSSSKWKVVVVSAIGGTFGAILLGLVLVAMVNVKRRRSRLAELERRAYEDEALRISMVGHVRAPTASGARTAPAIENDYNAPF